MNSPVIIIGGGLAGLYAGFLLRQRQIEFKILEATSRLGGRIFSQPHSSDADSVLNLDLGPAWFWPHQVEMLGLMKTLGIDYFEQYNQGEALFEAEKGLVERFVPSYMESYRVPGGMQCLVDKLVSKLGEECFELNAAVTKIESVDGNWQLSCANPEKSTYRAERLIIAAPPRVIIDKLETPDPTLCSLKQHLERVPTWMAAQAKFVVSYRRAFWREQGVSGQAFSRQGPMVEIHDASSEENNGYALFGFIGVPANHRKKIPLDDLKRACLTQLVGLFGEDASDVECCYLTDWADYEFIATQSDLDESPQHPQIDLTPFRDSLIAHRLYIASSEVAVSDPGYLRGAVVAAGDAVEALIHLD